MFYTSPLHIIPANISSNSIDGKTIRTAKKQLLVEFDLYSSTTINIKGQEYDKNQVIKLFESLEHEIQRDYHLRIFQNKPLLNFLEHGDTNFFIQPYEDDLIGDKDFALFVGPYFSSRYSNLLATALKMLDLKQLQDLLIDSLPLPDRFDGSCYKGAFRFINSKILDLDNLIFEAQKGRNVSREANTFINKEIIQVLNMLPDYFSGQRDTYAIKLRDLAIPLYNIGKKRKLAKQILKTGLNLKLSEDTREKMQVVLNQLESLEAEHSAWTTTKQGRETMSTATMAFLFFKIIFLSMLMLRACNSTSYRSNIYDYKFQNQQYNNFNFSDKQLQSNPNLKRLDSLLNELQKREAINKEIK